MNKKILMSQIVKAGMTQKEVAAKIGISLSRFNAKLNNYRGAEFSLGEMRKLVKLLSIPASLIDEIFLQ